MFEHFKGEEVFVKKVLDYLDQVQYKQRLILTQFLDPYHQSIVKSVIGHQDEVQVLENFACSNKLVLGSVSTSTAS